MGYARSFHAEEYRPEFKSIMPKILHTIPSVVSLIYTYIGYALHIPLIALCMLHIALKDRSTF